MANRERSAAWLFFTKTDDANVAVCNLCSSCLSYSGTTNLLKHLRAKHNDETANVVKWDCSQEEMESFDRSERADEEDVDDEMKLVAAAASSEQTPGRRNRSIVWNCFTKLHFSNIAECKFCGLQLAQDSGSTTGLMKHFVGKHQQEYMTALGSHATLSSPSAAVSAQLKRKLELSHTDGADSPGASAGRKQSVVWECFTKLPSTDVAKCKLCAAQLKTEAGSTSALLNHFMVQHKAEYMAAIRRHNVTKVLPKPKKANDDDPDYTPSGSQRAKQLRPMSQKFKKIKRESSLDVSNAEDESVDLQEVAGDDDGDDDDDEGELASPLPEGQVVAPKTRSLVWQCFTKVAGSESAECSLCGASLKSERGSTSGLLNHFIKKHNEEYRAALCDRYRKVDTRSSIIRQHFDQLSASDYWCCFCRRLLRQRHGSSSNLCKHLASQHPNEYRDIMQGLGVSRLETLRVKPEKADDADGDGTRKAGRKRHSQVWDYFTYDEQTKTSVTCLMCDAKLVYSRSTGSMLNHLKLKHPDVKVELSGKASEVSQPSQDDDEQHESSVEPNALTTVESIWRQHCQAREQEHKKQLKVLHDRLATLKQSMANLRRELTTVEEEIRSTEEKRNVELLREQELEDCFQQVVTEDNSAASEVTENGEVAQQTDEREEFLTERELKELIGSVEVSSSEVVEYNRELPSEVGDVMSEVTHGQ